MSTAAHGTPRTGGIADYEYVEALDDGTGARVFRARAPSRLGLDDGATVVVKVLAGSDEAAFRRLTRLLQTFASVRSPHLVELYDAGQQDDAFFYSMADWPLGTLANPAVPLEPAAVLRAMTVAARAAHDLHEAGIAHRDISPAAVLLRPDGARLGSLDLARALNGGGSVTAMAQIGSVGYVDPACIRGDTPSRASDIYSLGATLHHGLTGQGVHPDLDPADPVLAIRTVLREPPRLAADLSPGAAAVISDCLDPDPRQRPPTAAELADRIEALEDALA